MKKCECGGEVEQGKGCLSYLGSDDHMQNAQHEDFMRSAGLGFGTQDNSFVAMMSMHLQANGFSFEETSEILHYRSPAQAMGES